MTNEQMFERDGRWYTLEQLKKMSGETKEEAPVKEEVIVPEPVKDCQFCGKETKSAWHLGQHLPYCELNPDNIKKTAEDTVKDILE